MAWGQDERLYCTVYNQRNVTVLNSTGDVVDRLMLNGEQPINVAFSLKGRELLVTEVSNGQVEILPTPCMGLPLHYPKNGAPLNIGDLFYFNARKSAGRRRRFA